MIYGRRGKCYYRIPNMQVSNGSNSGKNAYSHLILSYSHYLLGIKKCLIRNIFPCLIALFFIPNRTIFSAIKETKFSYSHFFIEKVRSSFSHLFQYSRSNLDYDTFDSFTTDQMYCCFVQYIFQTKNQMRYQLCFTSSTNHLLSSSQSRPCPGQLQKTTRS